MSEWFKYRCVLEECEKPDCKFYKACHNPYKWRNKSVESLHQIYNQTVQFYFKLDEFDSILEQYVSLIFLAQALSKLSKQKSLYQERTKRYALPKEIGERLFQIVALKKQLSKKNTLAFLESKKKKCELTRVDMGLSNDSAFLSVVLGNLQDVLNQDIKHQNLPEVAAPFVEKDEGVITALGLNFLVNVNEIDPIMLPHSGVFNKQILKGISYAWSYPFLCEGPHDKTDSAQLAMRILEIDVIKDNWGKFDKNLRICATGIVTNQRITPVEKNSIEAKITHMISLGFSVIFAPKDNKKDIDDQIEQEIQKAISCKNIAEKWLTTKNKEFTTEKKREIKETIKKNLDAVSRKMTEKREKVYWVNDMKQVICILERLFDPRLPDLQDDFPIPKRDVFPRSNATKRIEMFLQDDDDKYLCVSGKRGTGKRVFLDATLLALKNKKQAVAHYSFFGKNKQSDSTSEIIYALKKGLYATNEMSSLCVKLQDFPPPRNEKKNIVFLKNLDMLNSSLIKNLFEIFDQTNTSFKFIISYANNLFPKRITRFNINFDSPEYWPHIPDTTMNSLNNKLHNKLYSHNDLMGSDIRDYIENNIVHGNMKRLQLFLLSGTDTTCHLCSILPIGSRAAKQCFKDNCKDLDFPISLYNAIYKLNQEPIPIACFKKMLNKLDKTKFYNFAHLKCVFGIDENKLLPQVPSTATKTFNDKIKSSLRKILFNLNMEYQYEKKLQPFLAIECQAVNILKQFVENKDNIENFSVTKSFESLIKFAKEALADCKKNTEWCSNLHKLILQGKRILEPSETSQFSFSNTEELELWKPEGTPENLSINTDINNIYFYKNKCFKANETKVLWQNEPEIIVIQHVKEGLVKIIDLDTKKEFERTYAKGFSIVDLAIKKEGEKLEILALGNTTKKQNVKLKSFTTTLKNSKAAPFTETNCILRGDASPIKLVALLNHTLIIWKKKAKTPPQYFITNELVVKSKYFKTLLEAIVVAMNGQSLNDKTITEYQLGTLVNTDIKIRTNSILYQKNSTIWGLHVPKSNLFTRLNDIYTNQEKTKLFLVHKKTTRSVDMEAIFQNKTQYSAKLANEITVENTPKLEEHVQNSNYALSIMSNEKEIFANQYLVGCKIKCGVEKGYFALVSPVKFDEAEARDFIISFSLPKQMPVKILSFPQKNTWVILNKQGELLILRKNI